MAEKYRIVGKDGLPIVDAIYAGHGASGAVRKRPDEVLQGQMPEIHCKNAGGTKFVKASESADFCYMKLGNYFGQFEGVEYEYRYKTCYIVELTIKVNGKVVDAQTVVMVNKEDSIQITANQAVTWGVDTKPVGAQFTGKNYTFKAPASGQIRITALSVCNPDKGDGRAWKAVNIKVKPPVLKLNEQDVHDIIKVVSTEVELRVSEEERKRQTQGVIDTILNRVFLDKNHSVRDVVNRRKQFSAISGNKDAYGSVQAMPDSEIKPWTARYTEEYLIQRTISEISSIGGNFNYFNPYKSNPDWGDEVKKQAIESGLIFGEGQFVHYHGTATGETQAPPLTIALPSNYQRKWD